MSAGRSERIETLVIGAGQSGLAMGYHLARQGLPFLIVDANERIGDVWRRRWDSLRLFSPAKLDALPGMRFPAPPNSFPTKDAMAAYLESYAAHFRLPVRTGTRIDRLSRADGRFVATSGDRRFEADNVVVAMANFQKPKVPDFARDLDPDIVQIHSIDYRNPGQLRDGSVLIVGAGNSGAEIGLELSRTHHVYMSGRPTGHLPFDIHGLPARLLLSRLVLRGVFHRVLTVDTPIGRRARPKIVGRGGPLIRTRPGILEQAGVQRVPRTIGTRDGRPLLEDGRTLDVTNVVWCCGFHPGFSWIDLPVLRNGEASHDRGIVTDQPGLYFVGLEFLYALSSVMVHGVERDAKRVALHIARRRGARRAAGSSAIGANMRSEFRNATHAASGSRGRVQP
ncbi:MAG TPA: NAD(P)-binding domain-containing protein [Longimicrobiales bacterium]